MNRDDDFIAQLEDYLDTFEGVVPLPELRRTVQARVPEVRQVRRSGGPERMFRMVSRMSTPARWGMGIAAVLAVAVLGAAALNVGGSGQPVGAGPTTTPPPSVQPTTLDSTSPEPSASASASGGPPPLPASGVASCGPGLANACNEPGTYRLSSNAWPATISMVVPTGWWTYKVASDQEGLLVEHGDAPSGSGWGVMFMTVGPVSRDACDTTSGRFDREETASVGQLVAAMESWPGFDVSAPTPIEMDGYAGQLIEVTSTRSDADCPTGNIWLAASSVGVNAYPMVGVSRQPRPGQFRYPGRRRRARGHPNDRIRRPLPARTWTGHRARSRAACRRPGRATSNPRVDPHHSLTLDIALRAASPRPVLRGRARSRRNGPATIPQTKEGLCVDRSSFWSWGRSLSPRVRRPRRPRRSCPRFHSPLRPSHRLRPPAGRRPPPALLRAPPSVSWPTASRRRSRSWAHPTGHWPRSARSGCWRPTSRRRPGAARRTWCELSPPRTRSMQRSSCPIASARGSSPPTMPSGPARRMRCSGSIPPPTRSSRPSRSTPARPSTSPPSVTAWCGLWPARRSCQTLSSGSTRRRRKQPSSSRSDPLVASRTRSMRCG